MEAAKVVAVDVETTGLDPHAGRLRAIAFAIGTDAWVIHDPYVKLPKRLYELGQDPGRCFVAHYMAFDYKWLKHHVGFEIASPLCTKIIETVITAGKKLPKRLKDLEERYLGLVRENKDEMQKSFINRTGPLTQEQRDYAAADVLNLLPILEQQLAIAKDLDVLATVELEMNLLPFVSNMELRGMTVDWAAWIARNVRIAEQLETDRLVVDELLKPQIYQTAMADPRLAVPLHVNLNSVAQVKGALRALGLDPGSSLDVAELKLLRKEAAERLGRESQAYRAIDALMAFRKLEKQRSTYGEAFVARRNPVTGRLHPDILADGAEATGRLSARNPNTMNIPSRGEASEIRDFFTAEPGRLVITIDYSQIELRIAAEVSGEEAMLTAFRTGRDLHTQTAAIMFNRDYDELARLIKEADELSKDQLTPEHKRAKELRSASKTINFGSVYGMGAGRLQAQLEDQGIVVSLDEAREMLRKYFRALPRLAAWLSDKKKQTRHFLVTQTLGGRKRFFTEPSDPNDHGAWAAIEREGANQPIQGTSADITKRAVILVSRAVNPLDAYVTNIVHDEIVLDAPATVAERVLELAKEQMLAAARTYLTVCPVEVGGKLGPHWLK